MAMDNHLEEVNKTYIEHLLGAWKVAFILIIHGLLPNVWRYKASDLLYKETKRSGIRIVD
jgi:hypothetical protein